MSLEKIMQALDEEATAQIREIERAVEAEIERVRGSAEADAELARRKHWPAMDARLETERARILNQARMEALRAVMGTREKLMEAALEAAATRLAALPLDETYGRVLEELACEAAAKLGQDGGLRLCVEGRDVPLMAAIARRMGLPASVEEGTTCDGTGWHCAGGVVATTGDGRVSLANTLSARLQRVANLYRSRVAGMLFEETCMPAGLEEEAA